MSEQEQLIRALARTSIDHILADLDELQGDAPFPEVTLTRSNRRFALVLTISRGEVPAIAGKITPPAVLKKSDVPAIRAAHRRVLDKIPVGHANRVKASTVLRQLFPKPNSYNSQLVTDLVKASLVLRDQDDQKVYRPA